MCYKDNNHVLQGQKAGGTGTTKRRNKWKTDKKWKNKEQKRPQETCNLSLEGCHLFRYDVKWNWGLGCNGRHKVQHVNTALCDVYIGVLGDV